MPYPDTTQKLQFRVQIQHRTTTPINLLGEVDFHFPWD